MTFPPEIWLQIAEYMPPLVVADLYSVNSQWFDIAMNARYRQISFAFLNRAMLRDLTRLRDPAVARRVRTLHVHPYFVKEVLEKAHEPLQLTPHPHSLRGKFKFAGLFRDHQKRLARSHRTSALLEFSSPADLVRTMIQVITGLPYVTHYHIAWSGLHSIQDLPISLEKTVDLLCHTSALENLEELDLFLRLDHVLPPEEYESILVDHLAPAINRLHPSLQKLSLRLCEPLDISPLFDSLRYMPFLDSLSVSIPMARPHLGHPSGFGKFLNRHRHSLGQLVLRATELSGDGLTPTEDPLSEWINDALSFVTGPVRLRSLEASLTLFPIEAAAMCLGRLGRTLTSLTLTGRHLPYDRVDELLSAVRRAGALVDLLAEKLPSLRRLDLLVKDCRAVRGRHPPLLRRNRAGLTARSCADDECYRATSSGRWSSVNTVNWGLRSISFSRSSFPYRLQYADDYKNLFMECIPTILRA
ncbi:hypothetical protein B0H11DRAFT_2005884 [Mycena galericulata]|nr:hypothetical protein B0H11DRAFT_2005884 [Mycena galericulata]